jgi:DNA mismatch repair protein MutL
LDAVLAPPELARPGARHLFLLVNGRSIADRALARAIAFAYGDRLHPGHYPRGVVSLQVPPEDVDVNAHPQKTEVRFRQSARLLDVVTRMVAPHLPSRPEGDSYWNARLGGIGPIRAEGAVPGSDQRPEVAQTESAYEPRPPNGLRYVAQVRQSLLLCESEDELIVIDRGRADAARRLDSLTNAAREGKVTQQNLLFPDRVQLPAASERALAVHDALIRSLGFEWSQLGENTHVVRAVPALVANARATTVFEAALHALSTRGRDAPDALEETLRALADAGATPNGEPLSDEDARQIVAAIWPSRQAHRPCIVARVSLSTLSRNAGGA